jgi:hypothetical protein
MAFSMPRPKMAAPGSGAKRLGPKVPSKRIGGIRTNFTQGIAMPKMSK